MNGATARFSDRKGFPPAASILQYTMPAWPRALFAIALVTTLLVTSVAPLGAHALSGSTDSNLSASPGPTLSVSEPILAVDTTYRIDVQSNGDARWSVNRTFQFDNESERSGFEELAEQFLEGRSPDRTLAAFEGASDLASATTGRPMEITNATRSTRVGSESGSLVLSFRWTNFTHHERGRIYVDDVFQTEPRWFADLSDGERLVITRPNGYQFYNVSTNVQNRALVWDGPHTFTTGRPYAVFNPISPPPTPSTPTATPTPTPTISPASDTTTTPIGAIFGAVIALGVLAGVGYAVYAGRVPRQQTGAESDTHITAESETDTTTVTGDGDESAGTPASDDSAIETAAEAGGMAVAGADSADNDADERATGDRQSGDQSDEDDIDETLLSDEERVERLLQRNDGRMKQARIVEETGWSNAKVSQLLSSMAEEGQIEKLRIGRENLISFPDEGPEH